jgi:hypothetical protein
MPVDVSLARRGGTNIRTRSPDARLPGRYACLLHDLVHSPVYMRRTNAEWTKFHAFAYALASARCASWLCIG